MTNNSVGLSPVVTHLDIQTILEGDFTVLDNLVSSKEVIITYKNEPVLIICKLPFRSARNIPCTPPRSARRVGAWSWY